MLGLIVAWAANGVLTSAGEIDMSKELEDLQETLASARAIFDLKQVVIGLPVIREAPRPKFLVGANIEDWQRVGSLIDKSQYRVKR